MKSASKNKSIMHRSRSLTQIPVLKDPRSLQKSKLKVEKQSLSSYGRSSSLLNMKRTNLYHSKENLSRPSAASMFTPLQSGYKLKSCSAIRKKDLRPINEKSWQKEQFSKVQTFFQTANLDVRTLRPPTILTFVTTMNILLKEFDNRINITTQNFKEEVPILLKLFNYPGSITVSMMKVVNTMHSFPNILAIWSWLIDTIEFLQNAPFMQSDFSKASEILLKYGATSFVAYQKCEDNAAAIEALKEDIGSLLPYDEEEFKVAQQKNDELEVRVQKLLKEDQLTYSKIQDCKQKINHIDESIAKYSLDEAERVEEYEKKMQLCMSKLANWDLKIENKLKEKDNYKAILKKQSHTIEENNALIERIEDMKKVIQRENERRDKQLVRISTYDSKLIEMKNKVTDSIFQSNDEISELTVHDPRLKNLLIRETGFLQADMLQEIENHNNYKSQLMAEFRDKHHENEQNITDLIKKKHEDMCTIAKQNIIINKKKTEIENVKSEIAKLQELFGKEIELQQETINAASMELSEISKTMPDVDAAEAKLKESTQKKINLENQQSELTRSGPEFFLKIQQQNCNFRARSNEILGSFTSSLAELANQAKETIDKVIEE